MKKWFAEPLKLSLGKSYNLNNMKEIKVNEDFLSLDIDVIKCQNKESVDECSSKQYLKESI